MFVIGSSECSVLVLDLDAMSLPQVLNLVMLVIGSSECSVLVLDLDAVSLPQVLKLGNVGHWQL